MKDKETFLLRTNDTAVFLSSFGFHTYNIIETKEEGKAINKIDISSWMHEFPDLQIEQKDVIFCRLDIEEFKKRHDQMYKEWKTLSHGWRTEKEKEQKEKKVLKLITPLHEWVNSFPIEKETQDILDNEVEKDSCSQCGEWFDEEILEWIEQESEMRCHECKLAWIEQEYNVRVVR